MADLWYVSNGTQTGEIPMTLDPKREYFLRCSDVSWPICGNCSQIV